MAQEVRTPQLPGESDEARAQHILLAVAAGFGIATLALFVLICVSRSWVIDPLGHPKPIDLLVFWTAGHEALKGAALAAYDPHFLQAMEFSLVGHPFGFALPWSYPPLFLFVAIVLASMPFLTAFAVWNGFSLLLQASVLSAVSRSRIGFLAFLAPPWILLGIVNGQAGLLVASLFGLVLLGLEKRPILSGAILGLLSCKPQLALLFPLALLSGGHWRAFASACLSILVWTVVSCAAFGPETFVAFLHGLSQGTHDYLMMNGIGWNKLQSVYGAARWLGAPMGIAWALQSCTTVACAALVIRVWRGGILFEMKAAVLAVASVLATPYVLVYDLAILSVAIAFLMRNRRFDTFESIALSLCVTAFAGYICPVGLIAAGTIGVVVIRRIRLLGAENPASQSRDLARSALLQARLVS